MGLGSVLVGVNLSSPHILENEQKICKVLTLVIEWAATARDRVYRWSSHQALARKTFDSKVPFLWKWELPLNAQRAACPALACVGTRRVCLTNDPDGCHPPQTLLAILARSWFLRVTILLSCGTLAVDEVSIKFVLLLPSRASLV